MRKLLSVGIMSGLLLTGAAGVVLAKDKIAKPSHKTQQTKMAKTPVTQDQAQAAALKKVPGTVDDSKMDTVKGKQMYWFAITSSKGQKEQVWVDTMGKVTKVTKEKMPKTMKTKTAK